MIDEFPLAPGVPMHLLTERGLNEAFLDVVEQHRRSDLTVVVRRDGQVTRLPVDQLAPEITRARNRIAELTAEIEERRRLQQLLAAPRTPFSGTKEHLKSMPPWTGGPTADDIIREDRDGRG